MEPQDHMTSEHTPALAHKPARAQGRKGGRAKVQKTATAKRALKLSIEVEIYERLSIHALRRGQTISEVVSDLATHHLNDWIIHAKPGPRSEGAA